jgi:phosphoglycerol transferase
MTRSEVYPTLITAFVALLLGAIALKIWDANLAVPFLYSFGGDVLDNAAITKMEEDSGWFFFSSKLGQPFGADFYQIPFDKFLHFFAIRLLLLVLPNAGLALNVYFLLCFPIIALIAYRVFRSLKLSCATSITVAVLYSLLPFRFLRSEGHLEFSCYYLLPPAVLLALWLAKPRTFFKTGASSIRLQTRFLFAVAISVFIGISNQYYALFSIVLFAMAGVIATTRRGRKALYPAILVCGITAASVFLNLVPASFYRLTHPGIANSYFREPQEGEIYGLKLIQLLLPVPGHHVGALAAARDFYDHLAPLDNENGSSSIGMLASFGFLGLLAVTLFAMQSQTKLISRVRDAATMNIACFLFATIGGFGSALSFYLLPEIRGYSRIAPLIAFLALYASGVALDLLRRYFSIRGIPKPAIRVAMIIVVILGFLDQTSDRLVPPYAQDKKEFFDRQAFVDQLEATLPINAKIFELPYVQYSFSVAPQHLQPDEELFPYLNSKTLAWSYGAPRFTAAGIWQESLSQLPIDAQLARLSLAGFSGVLVFRGGYADNGASVEAALRTYSHAAPPIVTPDGTWAFYSLEPGTEHLQNAFATQFANAQESVLSVFGGTSSGCYWDEQDTVGIYQWCSPDARLKLFNSTSISHNVHLSFGITGPGAQQPFSVSFGQSVIRISPNANGSFFSQDLLVPPGGELITLHTDAPPLEVDHDFRTLAFQIRDVRVDDHSLDSMGATFAFEHPQPQNTSQVMGAASTAQPSSAETQPSNVPLPPDVDSKLMVTGLYPAGNISGTTGSWSGGAITFTVPPSRLRNVHNLFLSFVSPDQIPACHLEVRANHTLLYATTTKSGPYEFKIPLKAANLKLITTFVIRSDTFKLATDPRALSIFVRGLRLQ